MSAPPRRERTEAPPRREQGDAPTADRCRACGAALERDQEWCLECGAARTSLQEAPDWRLAAAVVVAVVVAVLVVILIALS